MINYFEGPFNGNYSLEGIYISNEFLKLIKPFLEKQFEKEINIRDLQCLLHNTIDLELVKLFLINKNDQEKINSSKLKKILLRKKYICSFFLFTMKRNYTIKYKRNGFQMI